MVGRGFSCGTVADGFRNNQHLRLWVPAFAGTTVMIALSLSTQLSSSGLTGRSSTPRPLDYSQTSMEYWVARSRLRQGFDGACDLSGPPKLWRRRQAGR